MKRQTAAPDYPDTRHVGSHLVIDKTEWVPGEHPESHYRADGQRTYLESYFRCTLCGAERMRLRDFPDECDTERPESRQESTATIP